MLESIRKENANLRMFYYGKNKQYVEFIEKVNQEILQGVEKVN